MLTVSGLGFGCLGFWSVTVIKPRSHVSCGPMQIINSHNTSLHWEGETFSMLDRPRLGTRVQPARHCPPPATSDNHHRRIQMHDRRAKIHSCRPQARGCNLRLSEAAVQGESVYRVQWRLSVIEVLGSCMLVSWYFDVLWKVPLDYV